MEWHFRFGYSVIALLLFRIVWGFVGGYWSRFSQFLYSPATIIRYLRGQKTPAHEVGHNPLGSLSIWGLLLLLVAQVATGLVSDDEISNRGPLVKFVSEATSSLATSYHVGWGKWLIVGLVLLHIAAIGVYLIRKKQNLVKPMLTGDKPIDALCAHALPASKDQAAERITAFVVFVVIALGVTYAVQRLGVLTLT